MGVLTVIVTVVFLVYLLLRIAGMVGGGSPNTASSTLSEDNRPALPHRTPQEVQALFDSMPSEWVSYEGATPTLNLHVRGVTHELYRRVTRNHMEAYGLSVLDNMPIEQKMEVSNGMLPSINATAYVIGWRGAEYPNGKPLPYTPENLATLMRKDEMLRNFVSAESQRIGGDLWV